MSYFVKPIRVLIFIAITTSSFVAAETAEELKEVYKEYRKSIAEDLKSKKLKKFDEKLLPQGKVQPKKSIRAQMTYLKDKEDRVLIPKKALIYVPDYLKKYVTDKFGGRLISYQTLVKKKKQRFYSLTLTKEEVTGRKKIDPARIVEAKEQAKIVVVTFNGIPVPMPKFKGTPAELKR